MAVARVVPEVSLDRAFDYEIPPELRDRVLLGSRVRVPFGPRRIVGYVTELLEKSEVRALKPVLEVLGDGPFLPPRLIELARWMASYYCAPLAVGFKTILPEAVRRADAAFKQRLWVSPVVPALSPEVAALLEKKAPAQRAAWAFLEEHGSNWLADLAEGSGRGVGTWRALAERNLVRIEPRTQDRDPFAETPELHSTPHALNLEQQAALDAIEEETRAAKPRVVLLHGVTGSGKTEIYLRAIARVIEGGKSAIVLVPEIALTPQTVERFRARFAGMKAGVAVLHSHLSAGERHDQWQHIRSGRVRIVIGARSAIFAPLEEVGIIVVDEEHEHSYKQEESPHYQGRDVAVMRGHLEHAVVVLGSATPSLESFHHVREGKYRLAALNARVEEGRMPTTHILDLRGKGTGGVLLSPRLVEAVRLRLERKEQSIIFLNRRGYSTSLQCPQCGYIEMCPNCSVALTFYRKVERLRCHLCNHAARVPTGCPQCGFAPFKYAGTGTEKVEQAIAEAFPGARLARMDADSMRGKGAYESTLGAFAAGELDILVGTQMIAKGLHFPRVTCVGVINADLALQIPDFRASERVFQLLMQVSGRSGRGDVLGEVFVQTRVPFHPSIQFARHHDYAGFAEQELEFRRALHYPPYERFILVTARGRSEDKTSFVLGQLAQEIEKLELPGTEVTGPAPAPIARVEERYRFQLFLRTKKITAITPRLRPLFMDRAWPDDVRVSIDVDPVDLL